MRIATDAGILMRDRDAQMTVTPRA